MLICLPRTVLVLEVAVISIQIALHVQESSVFPLVSTHLTVVLSSTKVFILLNCITTYTMS